MRKPGRCRFGIGLSALALSGSLLLAGCSGGVVQTYYAEADPFQANFGTFDHPFTQAGEAEARRRAQSQCEGKKRVAVMTSRACSLSQCTTSFQCMTREEAATYEQAPAGKK